MSIAYPLQWPAGWPRTKPRDRRHGRFSYRTDRWSKEITAAMAIMRVEDELALFGFGLVAISTMLKVRKTDGLPQSGQREPDDPGAAVYFQTPADGQRCMACDVYTRVAQNIAAIAACLDAMRALERHGGQVFLDRAFTGFDALPAPDAQDNWWEVLGVDRDCSRATLEDAYRRLRGQAHPDRGGSADTMARINRAYALGKEAQ